MTGKRHWTDICVNYNLDHVRLCLFFFGFLILLSFCLFRGLFMKAFWNINPLRRPTAEKTVAVLEQQPDLLYQCLDRLAARYKVSSSKLTLDVEVMLLVLLFILTKS